ncbi:MAG: DUF5916 domain-containing protein, partial [Pseudomonadota bacterium]
AMEIQLGQHADSLRPETILKPNAGLDLNYAFDTGTHLQLAVNPDFGQIEVDPAVVNLSPYEVFFPERRPFFVASSGMFKTPLTMVHTRRIGAAPPAPEAEEDGTILEVDSEARILAAAKITGHEGRLSYGILSAGVLPTFAVEKKADGTIVDRRATMGAHFGAGRLGFRTGASSTLGMLLTAVTRADPAKSDSDTDSDLGADAYAVGFDWDLRNNSGWQTIGQIAGTWTHDKGGYGLTINAGQKGAPRWRYWITAESFSKHYEINDMGYQWRNDMVFFQLCAQHLQPAPWRFLRESWIMLLATYAFNHTNPELAFDRRLELNTWAKFTNLWQTWGGVGVRFFGMDDQETRGGPAYPRPMCIYFWFGGQSDHAQMVYLRTNNQAVKEQDAHYLALETSVNSILWNRLNLSLLGRGILFRQQPRWVETLNGPGRYRYIFGDLSQNQLELQLTATFVPHRRLSFQVFGQLLYSVGTYSSYRELYPLADGNSTLDAPDHDSNADFASFSIITNVVLRWDFGHGTAAYLVYKMNAPLNETGRPIAFDLANSLSRIVDQRNDHLLLAKISYAWDF